MFSISFDFDETTKKVSNVKVVERKSIDMLQEGAVVEVLDAKLLLSKDAVDLIGAKSDDRITVSYWTENNEETFPVIGLSSAFAEGSDSGNKLTKSNTVSFRGLQHKTLVKYGTGFRVLPFKEKLFKLEPINENAVTDDVKVASAQASLDHFASSIDIKLGVEESDDLPF